MLYQSSLMNFSFSEKLTKIWVKQLFSQNRLEINSNFVAFSYCLNFNSKGRHKNFNFVHVFTLKRHEKHCQILKRLFLIFHNTINLSWIVTASETSLTGRVDIWSLQRCDSFTWILKKTCLQPPNQPRVCNKDLYSIVGVCNKFEYLNC